MPNQPVKLAFPVLLLAAAACLLLAGPALAQMVQQPAPAPQSSPQIRMQQIQQRLATAQQAALAAHPELTTRQEELQQMVITTMEKAGFDPEGDLATLDSLRSQAQNPGLTQADQQQLMQTAMQAQQNLQSAQQAAMQDSALTAAQEDYRDDLIGAMTAEEPETEALIAELETLQAQMQQMQMMQQQMQQSPTPAPGTGK